MLRECDRAEREQMKEEGGVGRRKSRTKVRASGHTKPEDEEKREAS